MFLAVTFVNAISPKENTYVYVTVNTNGLINQNDIDQVILTFNADNGTWIRSKAYEGNGGYDFMAVGWGPGSIAPSLDIDEDDYPNLVFDIQVYTGNWYYSGGPHIYLTINIRRNSIEIPIDPIGL